LRAASSYDEFPDSMEWFNINIITGPAIGSLAPTPYTGETLFSQCFCRLILVIDREVHMLETFSMLRQEILVDGIPIDVLA
jgi:hypothetical protein